LAQRDTQGSWPTLVTVGQILVKHMRVLVVRNPLFYAINLRMSFIYCIFDLNKTTIMEGLSVSEMRVALEDKGIRAVALLKNSEVRYQYQKLFNYYDLDKSN